MKILAVIPARGGSKGIHKKNITLLAGKPLIVYTLLAAKKSKSLDRVIVSTDDDEIIDICKKFNVEFLRRPNNLSGDLSMTKDVLLHVVNQLSLIGYIPDAVMTLQPTSPLRTEKHIDESILLFSQDSSADSLVSCVTVPHIYHPCSVMKKNIDGYLEGFTDSSQISRRQDKSEVYARNGAAIYITRTEKLTQFIYGGRLVPYMMDSKFSVDIDNLSDLAEAEFQINNLT